jgi:hypothetical protein
MMPRDGEAQGRAVLRVFFKGKNRARTGVLEVVGTTKKAFLEFGVVFAEVVAEAEEAAGRARAEFCGKRFGETGDTLLVIVERLPLSGLTNSFQRMCEGHDGYSPSL